MRYYSKTTHTEISKSFDDTTIEYGSGVIDWWFEALKDGEKVLYWTDDMPYKYTQDFKKPIVENGIVIEGITQDELDAIDLENQKNTIKAEMNGLIGDMTPAESMLLMLKYGFAKMNPNDQDDDSGLPPLTPTGEDIITWGDRVSSELEAKLVQLRGLN